MSKSKTQKNFCAIVYVSGGGSSWYWDETPEKAAKNAIKQFKDDWESVFKFKKGDEVTANVFDMSQRRGWYMEGNTVYDQDTNEKLDRHSHITMPL